MLIPPLVQAGVLSTQLVTAYKNNKDLILFDASIPPVGASKIPSPHWPETAIGNAKRFDIENEFSNCDAPFPHTMISPENFEQLCQALGINNESHIVVYDNLGLFSAARAWWMFKAMGHDNVSVLDGGLPYWIKHGLPVAPVNSQGTGNGNFSARFNPQMFVDKSQVLYAIESGESLILDARAENRFLGLVAEPRAGVKSGHMPLAKNLPYAHLFIDELMKSKTQLTELFADINPKNKPLIMTCGSGITACILALAATIAHQENISVYDGSWAEWGSLPDCPVITS